MDEINGIAEKLAKDMKEISVAEFFEKNRHFLGYENPTRSLLTAVKEAIDNSLEFTCQANILPTIKVKVKEIEEGKYRVSVEDNGPGVIPEKVPHAFGRVLYGSAFHKLRQSRSLFGIGIKGACLYAQLTTGKPIKVVTSTGKKIHTFEIMIDVTKNEPIVISHKEEENPSHWHGLKVEYEVAGRYVKGEASIQEYIKRTAMVNPFAEIIFDGPDGKETFKRATEKMPVQPIEIKPHPYGVQLGVLRRMLTSTKARNLIGFLTKEFSRVGRNSALKICKLAKISPSKRPQEVDKDESERLYKAMQMVKLASPPTNCLSPVGEEDLILGLKKELKADHYVAVTRPPSVYSGFPFQVEVALAYGGELPPENAILIRFANRIPLLYHQGDCVITKAVKEVDWRRYGFSQSANSLPLGPLAILVHFVSVWVPFTSEGKQAIANYPEIFKEIKLALQDAGRELAKYIRKIKKMKEKELRRSIFERYLPVVAEAVGELTDKKAEEILNKLKNMIRGEKIEGSSEKA
jgi:DNA topoisomerase-6 subunit B